jgi:hypothetical protein
MPSGAPLGAGKGGRSKRPARLIVATFSHFTSRALDPQLHDHGLVLNLGLAEDGTWGTLEPKPIFQQQLALGAIYRTDLERRLKGLGLETEPDGEGFRLVAVDRELERLFSQRREEINERLEAWGRSSPQAAQAACLADPNSKAKHAAPGLRAGSGDCGPMPWGRADLPSKRRRPMATPQRRDRPSRAPSFRAPYRARIGSGPAAPGRLIQRGCSYSRY